MRCFYCEVVDGRVRVGDVWRSDGGKYGFTAFIPNQPRGAVHVVIVPNRHVADLADLDDAQGLARAIAAVTKALGLTSYRAEMDVRLPGEADHLAVHLLG